MAAQDMEVENPVTTDEFDQVVVTIQTQLPDEIDLGEDGTLFVEDRTESTRFES